jgi:hypothetical protein
MTFITKNLAYFAVAAIALTMAFRFVLSASLANESYIAVFISAVLYGASMFAAGWFYGSRDGKELPVYDVGFRFHFATFLSFHVVTSVWFLLGFTAEVEKLKPILLTVLIWGVLLSVHFVIYLILKKQSIDGLDKKELFD